MNTILGGNPSTEQLEILKEYKDGHNIICDAVAGGSKTSTALYLVDENKSHNFLMLTYNNALSLSCKKKCTEFNLLNIKISTYHSAMSHLFNTKSTITNDYLFNSVLSEIKENIIERKELGDLYDTIIVDEAQDIRKTYFKFICYVIRDCMVRKPQIVFIGARKQVLYDFYGIHSADYRFLTCADKLLKKHSKRTWKKKSLSSSFRLSPSNATFVNYMTSTPGRIKGLNVQNNKPIQYWICDIISNNTLKLIYENIIQKHTHIAFLFNSINSYMARFIVNMLSKVYNLKFDINTKVIRAERIYVSTYHAFKGMECDTTVVFGLHNFFNQEINNVPNSINVALTRSNCGNVFILHHSKNLFSNIYNTGKIHDMVLNLNNNICVTMYDPYLPTKQTKDKKTTYRNIENLIKFMEPIQLSEIINKHIRFHDHSNSRYSAPIKLNETDNNEYTDLIKCLCLLKLEYKVTSRCFKIEQLLLKINSTSSISIPVSYIKEIRTLYIKKEKTLCDWYIIAKMLLCYNKFHTYEDIVIDNNDIDIINKMYTNITQLDIKVFDFKRILYKMEDTVNLYSENAMYDSNNNMWFIEVVTDDDKPPYYKILNASQNAYIRNHKKCYLYNMLTGKSVEIHMTDGIVESVYNIYIKKEPTIRTEQEFLLYNEQDI